MRRFCRRLDIDTALTGRELKWLGGIVQPNTLRVTVPRPIVNEAPSGRASFRRPLELIRAHVAVVSLLHNLVYAKADRKDLNHSAELSDCTRRVVLHQYGSGIDGKYLAVYGTGLRELVLVFVPSDGEVRIRPYLERLVADLPRVAVTVVGLDEVYGRMSAAEIRELFGGPLAGVKLSTHAEHRLGVSAAQWALEMEVRDVL
jgi:hypothetical protein